MLRVICFVYLSLFQINFLYAQTLTIINDIDLEISYLTLRFDSQNKIQGFEKKVFNKKKLVDDSFFNLQDSFKGVVLKEKQGFNVVSFKLEDNFDPYLGGTFAITYLSNAITRRYKHMNLSVTYLNNEWIILIDKECVDEIMVYANRYLGQVVGIGKMDFISSNKFHDSCH